MGIEAKFVVAVAVLHERMPCNDHSCAAEVFNPLDSERRFFHGLVTEDVKHQTLPRG
jgi:hypothetical protein